MTIALVVHDFDDRYGQGRYCIELCRRLASRHRIDVFANTFGAEPIQGVQQFPVRAWRRWALTTIFSFLVSAQACLRGRHYEVVHAQGLTCWDADVITAHVCTAARLARRGAVRSGVSARIVLPWERRFYRQSRARHLIAVSGVVEREICEHYGWSKASSVIYHGTDPNLFRPASGPEEVHSVRTALGLPATGWLWLFVGEAVKGLSEVIEQLPGFPDARLLAVSRSDPAPYLEQARQLCVSSRFHFLGPRDELATVYRAADAFVYPSRYDTFGMVVTEAMASGLPSIVGRGIGAAELIEDGRNGLLWDPEDSASLRTALRRVAPGLELAASIAREGRRTIERHGWEACSSATEAVYRQVARVSP